MSDQQRRSDGWEYDVVVVGGGPAGCSAGVFLAREGLDTVIFDRGRSSLVRCAHLENYLGFPAGIDVETLSELMHGHAERAGCEIVPDLVESVDRTTAGDGFDVTLRDGESVSSRRVVAATRYGGEYVRGLDEAAFRTYQHDGEERERFDRSYADHDGTTPVEGLYVASPSMDDTQAITAAGRGARVARRVVTDARVEDGWWEAVADGVDWVRRESELDAELDDRAAWIEWFDERYAEDAPVEPDSDRFRRVRSAVLDRRRSSYADPTEIDTRAETAHERLAATLDPERIVAAVDRTAILDAMDDEAIRSYVDADRAEAGE